jgi:hypothetical protein
MRPVRNVFQKLSRTEQRREGVVAYLWVNPFPNPFSLFLSTISLTTLINYVSYWQEYAHLFCMYGIALSGRCPPLKRNPCESRRYRTVNGQIHHHDHYYCTGNSYT